MASGALISLLERWFGLSLSLLALFTLLLNVHGSDQFPFWSDEAYTTLAVRAHTWSDFLQVNLRNEETPPLYFALLRLWSAAWGDSREGTLRLFSALCLAAAIPVVGWLGQQLWDRQVGLLGALLLAANPFAHYYGQEARAYTLTLLLAALLFVATIRYIRRPSSTRWSIYVLTGILALYTNYFAVFALSGTGILGLVLARQRRATLYSWIFAHLVIALAWLLWLPSLRYQMAVSTSTLAPEGRSAWQQYLLALLVLGGSFPDSSALGSTLIVLIAATLPLALLRVLRSTHIEQRLFALATIVVPMIGVVLLFAGDGQFSPRYMVICLPAYVLILAAGLASPWRWAHISRTLLAIIVVLSAFYSLRHEQNPRREGGWDQIARIVEAEALPGDAVFFAPPWSQAAFTVQYQGMPPPLFGAEDFAGYYFERGNSFGQDIDLAELETHLDRGQRAWIVWDRIYAHRPLLPPGIVVEEQQLGSTTLLRVIPQLTGESVP